MRVRQKRREKTLLLLLTDKSAAVPVTEIHSVDSRQVGQVAAGTRAALRTDTTPVPSRVRRGRKRVFRGSRTNRKSQPSLPLYLSTSLVISDYSLGSRPTHASPKPALLLLPPHLLPTHHYHPSHIPHPQRPSITRIRRARPRPPQDATSERLVGHGAVAEGRARVAVARVVPVGVRDIGGRRRFPGLAAPELGGEAGHVPVRGDGLDVGHGLCGVRGRAVCDDANKIKAKEEKKRRRRSERQNQIKSTPKHICIRKNNNTPRHPSYTSARRNKACSSSLSSPRSLGRWRRPPPWQRAR